MYSFRKINDYTCIYNDVIYIRVDIKLINDQWRQQVQTTHFKKFYRDKGKDWMTTI